MEGVEKKRTRIFFAIYWFLDGFNELTRHIKFVFRAGFEEPLVNPNILWDQDRILYQLVDRLCELDKLSFKSIDLLN